MERANAGPPGRWRVFDVVVAALVVSVLVLLARGTSDRSERDAVPGVAEAEQESSPWASSGGIALGRRAARSRAPGGWPSRGALGLPSRRPPAPTASTPGTTSPLEPESNDPARLASSAAAEAVGDPGSPDSAAEPTGPSRRPLSGWVFDRRGDAAPGLRVFAQPRRLFGAAPAAAAATGSTRSGGDGSFYFPALVDGEYLVQTEETERYESASATIRAGVDAAVLTVEVKGGRTIRVFGTVESDRMSALGGVRVEPVIEPARATSTDEIGRYALTLPSRSATVHAIRFLKAGFRETRLNVDADQPGAEVRLDARLEQLRGKVVVSGSVTGDGSPLHLAAVQLYSASLARSYRTASDRSGRFALPDVETGEDYRLWVRAKAGYRDHVQDDLVVPGAGLEVPVALAPLEEATLSGQMIDPEGRPVPGLSLWLVTGSGGRGPILVTGDARGRFSADRLPEGEVVLQTRSDPLLSVTGITLSAGSSTLVRLPLDVGSQTLGGHVVDAQDRPVAAARASLQWSQDLSGVRGRSRRETACDAAGYFLFTQLGSGEHTLAVTAPAYRGVTLQHRVGADGQDIVVRILRASP
jgi:hypothetical protein